MNSADRSKNNADISLTYNPQLKTEDFNPEATPEKYLPKDRTTEETPNTYWTGLSEANSLNGGTLSGGTPDGESQGDYGKKYLHSGDIKPNAGLHEFNHLIAYAIGNAGVPDENGLYPHILTPGFGDKGNLHLAGLDENINALSLFKGMMSRKYGISVQNASHLRNFYEEFWQDKTSDSTEDKALKESIRSKIPPETRRLFDLMDSSKNLELFYQFLDGHNIMNQVSLPKSKEKNDVDYIPTMLA